jgi:regulator of RNase E activity RraA
MTTTRGTSGAPVTFEAVRGAITEYEISTCSISDVLDGLGITNAVLDSGLHRVSGGSAMFAGTAVPVSWVPTRKGSRITDRQPSTWQQVREFLVPGIHDGRGQVYVAGAGPLVTGAALAGGMSVTYLTQQLGFEGVVLGGAVRDRAVLEKLPRPVVASNFAPVDTQGAFRVESSGRSCLIGNVAVRSGDWVFSDGNGTVVVPPDAVAEVLRAAIEIESTESQMLSLIAAGHRLPEVIDRTGRI